MQLLPLLFLIPSALGLAFPGAEGFGRNAIGGRKGSVYVVTNLNDSGAGSLRDAVSQTDRIVVFVVGGVIKITERMVVSKRITILGQTAPGDGITVYGNGWSFSNADDAIVRYIRIRMGKGGTSGKDAITIAEGSNMIFDHVSVTWGRDETFSISGSKVGNITVQNSIIGQGLETHSCGGLMQTALGNGISLFRNLYIDNKTRNPKVKGTNDFTNNVVYNWGGGGGYIAGDSAGESNAHIIGNYFISGPSTSKTAFTRGNAEFKAYVEGNFYDSDKDGKLSGTELGVTSANYGGVAIQTAKFGFPAPGKILSAADALTYVMGKAGASLARDAVDKVLIAQVQSFGKTGATISDEATMGGVGTIDGGAKRVDTDGDGIPDDVEAKMGFNAALNDAMADKDGNGYTTRIKHVAKRSLVHGFANPGRSADATATKRGWRTKVLVYLMTIPSRVLKQIEYTDGVGYTTNRALVIKQSRALAAKELQKQHRLNARNLQRTSTSGTKTLDDAEVGTSRRAPRGIS
ncbi:pectin lyase-like protein [Bimuria novae-zelandiae CBS 107.79]|uniref:Probable pectate lyase C n=1 Tax=Bimuria novae-zelandiae CBS 107.79 TaxID=1447943 RepID=A0A6A5USY2_9PLEO|nr:pectin lyase-like protein [Bimuria novae-zelandiae CBS 107.79]